MTDDYSYETAGKGIKDEIEGEQAEADDMIDEAEDMFEDGRERAESWLEEQIVAAREQTRAEPFKALMIAAGVGAIIGALFLR